MGRRRVIVGAVGCADDVPGVARTLRDTGFEIVFVGGGQTPEQLVGAAIAEDADEIVVAGDAEALERIRMLLDGLGAHDITITPVDGRGRDPRSPR